jgi:hypothetical protein
LTEFEPGRLRTATTEITEASERGFSVLSSFDIAQDDPEPVEGSVCSVVDPQ